MECKQVKDKNKNAILQLGVVHKSFKIFGRKRDTFVFY